MATNEELQQQINQLSQKLNILETNFNKNEYSNLSVFLKKVAFKGGLLNVGHATMTGGICFVNDALITTKSFIFAFPAYPESGALGTLYITAQATGSCTITSTSNIQAGEINYLIL